MLETTAPPDPVRPANNQSHELRTASHLLGYNMQATDGRFGHAEDLLFDDLSWNVRYVVADTGSFLPGKRVLISPSSLEPPKWDDRAVPVTLTKARIEDGPHLDDDMPVSRQHEEALAAAYGWPAYWTGFTPGLPGLDGSGVALASAIRARRSADKDEQADPHLRSVKEVRGYLVKGRDGRIGKIDDLIVETTRWTIHYLVIDTRPWWFGGRVLVAPAWCTSVNWKDHTTQISLTREQVRNAPRFESAM